MLCDYGCEQEAKHQFKNGKWCCSKSHNSCPINKEKNIQSHLGEKNVMFGKKGPWLNKKFSKTHRNNISDSIKGKKHPLYGKKRDKKICVKISKSNKGKKRTLEQNHRNSLYRRQTISKLKQKYPLFSKIEKMRYNPDKPGEKEIQVHCKNHNCPNSKEQGGWFTPTYNQLYERIRQLEKDYGNGGSYFYCSDECKDECPLFNLRSNPFQITNEKYTQDEYKQFREFVLERDDYECQYCGEKAEHVHHERPQKLEPFYSLDPDLAWSCCEKCHYKYGHKDECSTGQLANKICI